MTPTHKRESLRRLLDAGETLFPGSVFDPVSARIAEDLGFELGMFAGSVASLTVLGAPDIIVLTLSEFAHQCRRITRAGNLPLLVDADHGYGNAMSVMRTVEELETAGVAALSIEDTALPRAHGQRETRLLSMEEGVGKMRAALEARQDPSLIVAGRTSAIRITGLEDTIRRARAYAETGVDAIFLVGVRTREELDAVSAEIDLPLILGGAPAALQDRAYLSMRGVGVCLQGHAPFQAAVQAVRDTLAALRDGTAPADLKGIASRELMDRVSRAGDYERRDRDYLG